jgi:hypothetical protein
VLLTVRYSPLLLYIARLSGTPYTIGLASSTIFVRRSEPTTRVEVPGRRVMTPYVKLLLMAKSALLFDVMNTPPLLMNSRRCMRPSRPMPMRVSSVCAQVPMFGVSGEFLYGIALRHSGVPSTAPCPPPGPNTMTSYLSRRFAVSRMAFGSM